MSILLRGPAPFLVTFVLALGCAAAAPAAPSETARTTTDRTERMDAYIEERMDEVGVPGIAYAIVGPTGITHTGTFGDDGNGEPVTATTPFLWGSDAKPVTATLVMQLVRDGDLRLDEPVRTYLPDFRLSDERASDRITIRQLLAQTSGIPESMDLTDHFESDRRPEDVLPQLAERDLESEPGEEHVYSSINYQLLAAVVEAVTGRPFVEVLTERVLEPAGMDGAITTQQDAERRLPPGHRFLLGRAVSFDSPYDPAGTGYGYLGGTLEDAAGFVRANLGDNDTLLDRSMRERMYRGEVETDDDRTYGLGWRRWPVEGTDAPMVWHSGTSPGYFASMIMLPEKNRGIVVLQNAYGGFQENQVLYTALGLAQLMYGEQPYTGDTDPVYWGLLGVLVAICLVLVILTTLSALRLLRGRTTPHPGVRRLALRGTAWVVPLLAVLYCTAVVLPGYYGVRLGQVVLWAPDVAWLAYAILGLSGTLLVLRLAVLARTARAAG